MKKYLILTLSVFMFFSVSIKAQEQVNKPVNIIEKRAEKMALELGLNDTEKAQVKTLFEKQSIEVKKQKNQLTPESADFKVKMKELHKAQDEELKKIIGKEKFAKMKENRAQEKKKMEAAKDKM